MSWVPVVRASTESGPVRPTRDTASPPTPSRLGNSSLPFLELERDTSRDLLPDQAEILTVHEYITVSIVTLMLRYGLHRADRTEKNRRLVVFTQCPRKCVEQYLYFSSVKQNSLRP
jgi:hypothetical protein